MIWSRHLGRRRIYHICLKGLSGHCRLGEFYTLILLVGEHGNGANEEMAGKKDLHVAGSAS